MINNSEEIPRDESPRGSFGIHVTLNPKGVIRLSRATHQMLGSPQAYKLLYDKANCRIGLKATEPKQPNAYPAGVGNCGAKVVRACRLMRTHNLDLSAAIEFQDARIDENNVLVLDLRTAKVSNRVRKQATRTDGGGERSAIPAGDDCNSVGCNPTTGVPGIFGSLKGTAERGDLEHASRHSGRLQRPRALSLRTVGLHPTLFQWSLSGTELTAASRALLTR